MDLKMSRVPEKLHVLLIEDNPSDAGLIQANLRLGLPNVLVDHFVRLSPAVEALQHASFSVILLDLNLPDSSGLDTFRKLAPAAADTPVVILSGMDDDDKAVQAVAAGADDYVPKQHYDAHTLARSIRFAIERSERKRTEKKLDEASAALKAAQHIQDSFYVEPPPQIDGFDIACGVRSAGIGCGDYFDFIPLHDGRQMIVVADVAGHGMASALVMAETRTGLRALADVNVPPEAMLDTMNRVICAGTSPEMFVTLALVTLDPVTGVFTYANAGHPGWIIRGGKTSEPLTTHQIPLGLMPDVRYEESDDFRLNSGDILLLPTDGIVETPSEQGIFGVERLINCVVENQSLGAQAVVDSLFERAAAFSGDQPQADDMTAVVFKAL